MRRISILLALWLALLPAVGPRIHARQSAGQIALTFDDGPSATHTLRILDILDRYHIPATFFAVGVNIQAHPELLSEIHRRGHEIGNHTFSHPHLKKTDSATLAEELDRTADLIASITGSRPTLFRPPEGVVNDSVRTIVKNSGYRVVLWSIDTEDWRHRPAEQIADHVIRTARDGSIVLFHDWIARNSPTPDALETVIPALLEKGFTFVRVSELGEQK